MDAYLEEVSDLIPTENYWYLAGPMTVKGEDLNFPEFNRYAAMLRAQGYIIANPAEFPNEAELSWEDCLMRDLIVVAHPRCVGVFLLPDWWLSPGACLERDTAAKLHKQVHEVGVQVSLTPPAGAVVHSLGEIRRKKV